MGGIIASVVREKPEVGSDRWRPNLNSLRVLSVLGVSAVRYSALIHRRDAEDTETAQSQSEIRALPGRHLRHLINLNRRLTAFYLHLAHGNYRGVMLTSR